jgi:hypothetical protein
LNLNLTKIILPVPVVGHTGRCQCQWRSQCLFVFDLQCILLYNHTVVICQWRINASRIMQFRLRTYHTLFMESNSQRPTRHTGTLYLWRVVPSGRRACNGSGDSDTCTEGPFMMILKAKKRDSRASARRSSSETGPASVALPFQVAATTGAGPHRSQWGDASRG